MNKSAILVVDDDISMRMSLRTALESSAYAVFATANGVEAETIYQHSSISLVITDLTMPKRSGIETIIALRRELPDVPVTAMSERFPDGVSDAALHLGAKAVDAAQSGRVGLFEG